MKKSFKKMLAVATVLALLLTTFVVPSTVSANGPTTVYTSPAGTLAPGTLYPRAMQTSDGKLYATWESYTTGVSKFPIFQSSDNGVSWTKVGDVEDTHKGVGMRWEPALFELPQQIGDMPKGTLLAAGLVLPYDRSFCEIDLYKSNDEGKNWTYVSTIAEGKKAFPGDDPVWEPFFLVHNDKLICYYSDERDPAHNQKLVHQTTTDGVNWGPVVDDVADPVASQRPGMATVAQMPDGKFIMTYEIMGTPSGAYYKISDDPENFNPTQPGTCFDPKGSGPYVVNLNGTIILSSGGNNNLYINTNSGIGDWEQISSPIGACYSRCLVPLQNGRLFVINAGWNGSSLNSVTCADMAVVPSPGLSEIDVDGKPLDGFTTASGAYSLVLPEGATTVPAITVKVKSPTDSASVENATSIPGVTTVTVSNGIDTKKYYITFGHAPTSTSFMEGNIDSDWSILNPDSQNYSVVAGSGLRLPTQDNDIYSTSSNWKNVFVRPAAGDWDIVSKVYFPVAPYANYQQMSLLAWQDEDNYIKLDCENNNSSSVKIQFGSEKDAKFTSAASSTYSVTSGSAIQLYYRIKKTGNIYTGYYSADGKKYTTLGTISNELNNTQIGLFATRNSTNPVIDTYCQEITVQSASNPIGAAPPTWSQGSELTPSSVVTDGLTLTWPAAQDDKAVTGYRIYNGELLLATVPESTLSYNVSGLTPGTSYTFRVEAGDADKAWSSDGPACTVTTVDTPDLSNPTWPQESSITPSEVYGDNLLLTWTAATDDKAVTKYNIYNGADLIATVDAADINTYKITGLIPNTTYTFKIEAGDKAGKWSTDGPSLTIKTPLILKYEAEDAVLTGGPKAAADHTGYSGTGFVGGLSNNATAKVSFSINTPLSGTYSLLLRYVNAKGATCTNIGLYVNGAKIKNLSIPVTANWDTWGDLTEPITLNGGSNIIDFKTESASNAINMDYINITRVSDAAVPVWSQDKSITTSALSSSGVKLTWSSAQDDKAVKNYRIYNGTDIIATVDNINSYEVTGLSPATAYTFRVEAGDEEGNWSVGGPSATVTTNGATDTSAPTWAKDSELTASEVTSRGLTLTWPAAQDDKGVTGYRIFNGSDLVTTVDGSATSCDVTGLTPDTAYTFKVEAGDAAGNLSTDGPSKAVTTLKENTPPTEDKTAPAWPKDSTLTASNVLTTSLTLTWPTAQDDTAVTGYKVYRGSDMIATLTGAAINHYDVTGLTPGTAYTFKVEAGDSAGNWSTDGPSKAVVTLTGGSGSNSGTSGNSGTTSNTGTTAATGKVEVKDGVITAQPKVTNNVAAVEITKDILDKALSTSSTAKIVVAAANSAKEYVQTLPVSSLQSSDSSKKIVIETPVGTAIVPANALKAENIQQKTVDISLATSDNTALSQDLKKQIGDRPVVDVSLKAGGNKLSISNPLTPVTVSINYKPAANELANAEHIVVCSIDNNGKATPVTSGKYDAKTGKVTFTATEPGKYAVTYVEKSFEDTNKAKWAEDQIEVLASKGIIGGTSETTFSPEKSITRADYITMLMNALGLKSNESNAFDDVKPGDYYFNAVATAKKLGITDGTGDNKFSPEELISRQDMIVLTEKALKIAKEIAQGGSDRDLEKFSDKSSISSYAVGSIANFVNAGLISGSNGSINPKQNATRAEAAVLIYKIYNK
ncbi:MAG TPA: fibronectin type III domain-containing protein [Ruminiclostridium sp.]|nr:fibronectin type III domain-containing protein [Ruminiclostridium sp.]